MRRRKDAAYSYIKYINHINYKNLTLVKTQKNNTGHNLARRVPRGCPADASHVLIGLLLLLIDLGDQHPGLDADLLVYHGASQQKECSYNAMDSSISAAARPHWAQGHLMISARSRCNRWMTSVAL